MLPYGTFSPPPRANCAMISICCRTGSAPASNRSVTGCRPCRRQGERGIPFFFARVDQAGNITKRHSATKLQFARFGSACPLWNVYRAFETPGRIIRQLAETPDGYTLYLPGTGNQQALRRLPRSGAALCPGHRLRDTPRRRTGLCRRSRSSARTQRSSRSVYPAASATAGPAISAAVPPLKRKLVVRQDQRNLVPYSFE